MSFKSIIAPFASIVGGALILIVIFLGVYAWPAVKINGFGFITQNTWNLGSMYADPILHNGHLMLPGAQYGILFLIVGTLLSTLIAVVLAVPLGVGSAIFLAEGVPAPLRPWLSFFVELLAAVPSVVYGLWGYVAVIPLLSKHVFPWMARHLSFIPFFCRGDWQRLRVADGGAGADADDCAADYVDDAGCAGEPAAGAAGSGSGVGGDAF
jgi:phosphate transport system permease protein